MGKVKQAQQDIIDICAVLYGKLGVAGVCDHVNQELLNRTPEYMDVKYVHCTGCDADMPSIGGTCLVCGHTVTPLYFTIVRQGWNKELQREEIQIHCGENGNLFLIKTEQGFIVDVYNQDENINTMTVWEDDLEPSGEYYEIDEEADCLSIKTCEHKKNGKCYSKDACDGKIVEN